MIVLPCRWRSEIFKLLRLGRGTHVGDKSRLKAPQPYWADFHRPSNPHWHASTNDDGRARVLSPQKTLRRAPALRLMGDQLVFCIIVISLRQSSRTPDYLSRHCPALWKPCWKNLESSSTHSFSALEAPAVREYEPCRRVPYRTGILVASQNLLRACLAGRGAL